MINKGALKWVGRRGNGTTLAARIEGLSRYIPCLLIFLLARAVLGDGLRPFAIPAYIALGRANPLLAAGALAVGHLSSGAGGLLWLLLPLLPIHWIRIRSPTLPTMAMVMLAVAGQAMFRLPGVLAQPQLPYDWLLYGLELGLAAVSIQIFHIASRALDQRPIGVLGDPEHSLCLVVTSVLALTSLAGIGWGPILVLPVLAIWLTLIIAVAGGTGAGACAGVIAGILVGYGYLAPGLAVASFAMAGLLAGMFSHWGRVGAIAGLVAGYAAMVIYGGQSPGIPGTANIALACAAFVATPGAVLRRPRRWLSANAEWVWEYQQRLRASAVGKLQRLAHIFSRLSQSFMENNGQFSLDSQLQLSKVFEHVASEVCTGCMNYRRCWETELYSSYSQLLDYLVRAEKEEDKKQCELEGLLGRRCPNLEQLLTSARKCYQRYASERQWAVQLQECKNVVSEQLRGVSEVISQLSRQVRLDVHSRREVEAELERRLAGWGVVVEKLTVMGTERGQPLVELKAAIPGGENPLGLIQAQVSEAVGQPLELVQRASAGDLVELRFARPVRFELDFGVAQYSREDVNGDCFSQMQTASGCHVYMLSDGMGKGQKARSESNQALLLARDMLDVGFPAETAIKAINSLLVLRHGHEHFATLDMAVVDCRAGRVDIYKTGAAASYIKRDSNVETVSGAGLPIGIVPGVEPQQISRRVQAGDYLVMISDGIIDGTDRDDVWVADQLRSFGKIAAGTMAKQLLNRATRTGRTLGDDATVLVVRVQPVSAKLCAG